MTDSAPATEDIAALPSWAVVALASRCAKRALQFVPPQRRPDLAKHFLRHDQPIIDLLIESFADSSEIDVLAAIRAVRNAAESAEHNREKHDIAGWAQQAAMDAIDAAQTAEAQNQIAEGIHLDLQVLRDASKRYAWDDQSQDPLTYFELHTTFEVGRDQAKENISAIVNIDAHLVEYFRRNPEKLFSMHPRAFEELIAELFDMFGFEVTLTAQSKDGGRDIVAIDKRGAQPAWHTKYLVECKRYARTRKVGIGVVRALHGVIADEGATKGVIATTSYFTRGAMDHLERNKWLLEGRDFDGIVQWLALYEQYRIGWTLTEHGT